MKPREILLQALKNQKTSRPAWVPFVGTHGGALIGADATTYLKSADLLVAGLKKAREMYRPDGLPVVFDLQMEAEILGCSLEWSKDGPPSVSSHPLEDYDEDTPVAEELAKLPAFNLEKGRFPLTLEATRRLKKEFGDEVALYGLICGPFTLALHLLGNEIFCEMYDNEERVQAIIDYCAQIGIAAATGYIEAGCDVIAVVDPMVSQISPEHFELFAGPYMDKIFDSVHKQGKLASLFVCGDATRNIEKMCLTRCDNISVDENVNLHALYEASRKYGKSVGGNLRLTTVLLMGTENDSRRDAVRCLDDAGDTGFVLAPGCDLPYAVKPVNVAAAGEVARDAYQQQVARTLEASAADAFDDIILPDYKTAKKVIVDCVTLDSLTCPPCQYMVAAARKACEEIGAQAEWHEHKITGRDGLGYLTKLKLSNIPAICINGEAAFVSLIPDHATLVSAIRAKIG